MAKASGKNRYMRRSGGAPGGGGLGAAGGANPLAQAQEMFARAQEELQAAVIEGTAGGGAVRVTMTGDQRISGITIEPEVVDPAAPRPRSAASRVFFGATVTYKDAAGREHAVSIVGIDEVDLNRRYISWVSPLARALMKSTPGDRVVLRAPTKIEHLEIVDVEYVPIPMDPFREPPGAEAASR